MKRFLRTPLLTLVLILASCGADGTAPLPPVSATQTPIQINSDEVAASAIVVPARTSKLSFLISGTVKEIKVKEGDQVAAGQTLTALDVPDLYYQTLQAKAVLRSARAEAEIQRYRKKTTNQSGKTIYLSGPRELIEAADAKVLQAQAALDRAQASLAQGTLLAPYGATVVEVNIVSGQFIQPGQVAIVVGDLKTLQIETTDLGERDIPRVKIGQRATIYIEALDIEFNGIVESISPIAEIVGGDTTYKVTLAFDKQPDGLLWGMNAEIKINVAP